MSVRTKEELLKSAKDILGENADDTALSFLEDIEDTFKDAETKTKDTTDWKAKFEENDANWRKKYRDRFFGGEDEDDVVPEDGRTKEAKTDDDEKPSKEETITYDDLFTEKE